VIVDGCPEAILTSNFASKKLQRRMGESTALNAFHDANCTMMSEEQGIAALPLARCKAAVDVPLYLVRVVAHYNSTGRERTL
jgi:hypothetical protein